MAENIVEILSHPALASRCTPAAVPRMLAAGVIVAALFGSAPLDGWAQRLPPSVATDHVQTATAFWNEKMTAIGLAQWHARVRAALRSLKELRFVDPAQ